MKLQTFNSSNMVTQRKGDATIAFSRKSANSLSKAAVERTGYEVGDQISLHQDEENPEDWYISLGEDGFTLRDSKGSGSLVFNNVAMANTLLDALGIDEDRCAFFIAGQATEIDEVKYWAILTTKPIIKQRNRKKD